MELDAGAMGRACTLDTSLPEIDSPAMVSRELMRNDPQGVIERLASRGVDPALPQSWLRLDAERRAALVEVEELKRQRNEASRAIGAVKQRGGDAAAEIAAVASIKERAAVLDARLAVLEPEIAAIELIDSSFSRAFFAADQVSAPQRRSDIWR